MKTNILVLLALSGWVSNANAQETDPVITSWLQNNTQTGSYYTTGNSTAASNGLLVNCQSVKYSNSWVYVSTKGIPSYPTGPFQDGNPSQATDQNGIFKFPRVPQKNTGTPVATNMGNIGIFINGVALFDFQDGVAWNTATSSWCGGPGNPPCSGTKYWTRDAVVFERKGFDCAKGHPAQGNYHHHQNPSAFKLDKQVLSTICNLFDADGLYAIDSTKHSPLIGFAYDGYPIYGAMGYKNTDGTGGIVRMKSSFSLRNITARTHHADGTDVPDGPAISSTYPLGTFKEDYEFITPTSSDYLDEHNGRFCVTPEYPNGTYAYFATVDVNWNSAFPYVVGTTYYGVKQAAKVTAISETVTTYSPSAGVNLEGGKMQFAVQIVPNPAADFIAVQYLGLVKTTVTISLLDVQGRIVKSSKVEPGSTIGYIETQELYDGNYIIKVQQGDQIQSQVVLIHH